MTEIVEEPATQAVHKSVSNASSSNATQDIGVELGHLDAPVVDYLDYFGLSLDPFEASIAPLFQGGEREATLSQLLHLSQFSNSVSVVIGDSGVGKTCFRTTFLEYLEEQDIVCELEVPAINNLDQILSEIVYQFGISMPQDNDKTSRNESDQLFNSLHQFGALAEEGDPLKIVCIDDAHHLDDFTLERLIELAQPLTNETRHIHVVVFGEPQLRERISAIGKKKLAANQSLLFQFLVLKPLTIGELKEYLRFRLDNAGFDGLFPYKDEDIQFLWDISQGVPAALHDAAREILIELAMPPPENKSFGLPPVHLTLLAMLVVGLLVAVFYQSRNEPEQTPLATIDEEFIGEQEEKVQQPVVSFDSTKSTLSEPLDDSNLEQASSHLAIEQVLQADPDSEVKVRATFDLKAAAPVLEPKTTDTRADVSPQIKPKESSLSSSKITSSPRQPAQTQENQKANPPENQLEEKPVERSTVKNEKILLSVAETALLNKPSESFALQILVASSLASAEDFIGRQSNVKDLSVYPAQRNKKTVFIIVAGSFPTLALARDAIKSLPDEQQKTGPWPRTFNSVHSDIRQFREL